MRKAILAAVAALSLTGLTATPALARTLPSVPRPITISVDDEHNVLTTPCILFVGETLTGFGYVTGTFTVTSIADDGPVYRITLSPLPKPPQSSEVLDFHVTL